MRKPRVITRCVANHYTAANERIIEFSNGERGSETHKGGLISFRNMPDGTLRVDVYCCDAGVAVVGPKDRAEG